MPAANRRKHYSKQDGRGRSLDEAHPDDRSSTGLKTAVSLSQLNGDQSGGGLLVPGEKKSSSKLSLLGEKLIDTAKQIGEKKAKKSKSPFSNFLKSKTRDSSPQGSKRTRSVEYGSLDRRQMPGAQNQKERKLSPKPRSQTLPPSKTMDSVTTDGETPSSQGPVINIEAPRGIIPYEFQDALGKRHMFGRDFTGSEGSDPDNSESDLQELMAIADSIDEYNFSVRIFPGQDPAQVFVGWVTPGFHFNESNFDMKKTRHVVLTVLDNNYAIRQRYVELKLFVGYFCL